MCFAGRCPAIDICSQRRHADRGNQLADSAGESLGFRWTPVVFKVPSRLPGLDAQVVEPDDDALLLGNEWSSIDVIALLETARHRLAAQMRAHNHAVPDDLPGEDDIEQDFGTRGKRQWAAVFVMVAVLAFALFVGMNS